MTFKEIVKSFTVVEITKGIIGMSVAVFAVYTFYIAMCCAIGR